MNPRALTDLEVDALAIAESIEGYAGAWRLGPPPFLLQPGEVAYEVVVAIRNPPSLEHDLARFTVLAGRGGDRVLVFDPAEGPPSPLRRATPIALGELDRARARARAKERAAASRDASLRFHREPPPPRALLPDDPLDPVNDPFPSTNVVELHPARAACAPQSSRCHAVRRSRPALRWAGPARRVLVVDREALIALPLRGELRGRVSLTRVATRWEALERLEYQPFDRILVVERPAEPESDEPSLFRFYRAACTLWPHLASRFLFAVDDATRQSVASRRSELASRFVRRELGAIAAALLD